MRRLLLPIAMLGTFLAHAGGEPLPLGARFVGMGWTGLSAVDLWSIRLNPAGIAGLEVPAVGLSYQRHFLSEDLAHQGIAVALPLGNGTLGIGVDRFGYSLYNETRSSLTYAMRFGDGLRAAVQMDHLGVRLGGNYGSTGVLVAEFGVQAAITEELWIGAHIYNPTRTSLMKKEDGAVPIDEEIPTLIRAGFQYTFGTKLIMNLEAEKDIDRQESVRFGIEYNPTKVLYLRTGISTEPTQSHFGVGFRLERIDIDMAVAVRSQLGTTPIINLNYRFR